jgi:hypothetical protein
MIALNTGASAFNKTKHFSLPATSLFRIFHKVDTVTSRADLLSAKHVF